MTWKFEMIDGPWSGEHLGGGAPRWGLMDLPGLGDDGPPPIILVGLHDGRVRWWPPDEVLAVDGLHGPVPADAVAYALRTREDDPAGGDGCCVYRMVQ